MPRASNKTLICLRVFDGDLERLRRFYPNNPYNEVIRGLISAHLNRLEERERVQRLNSLPQSAHDLPEVTTDIFEKGNPNA